MQDIYLLLAENNRLETEHLILRPVTLADAPDIYEIGSNPNIIKYVSYAIHQDLEDTRRSIANHFMRHPLGKYGIILKKNQRLVGTIDLMIKSQNVAEIGYQLNEKFHRQGIMTEAAGKIVQLSFEKLKMKRVFATCLTSNIASSGVMKKIGMTQEGTLRGQLKKGNYFYDMDVYSLLSDEYKNKNIS
ncbi:GNAT family N-acetyltransferase [Allofustis seminis]|uniref:GNAT family N-acetyltransferase n=1 Tax=Allofustis seminis TaxID=166939 RepID=UPI00037D790E|nr:GNAT family protein [Allofustis seminis]